MNVNRRDLLKLFGIGATIVPVLSGVPKIEAPARLIETPVIEPVKLATQADIPAAVFDAFAGQACFITVDILSAEGHSRFRAKSFFVDARVEFIDVTTYEDPVRRFIPGVPSPTTWQLNGVCTGPVMLERVR